MGKDRIGLSLWWSGLLVAMCGSAAVAWYSVRPVEPVAGSLPVIDDPAAGVILDEEQRNFLWQVEHHGNLLSSHGFSAIGQALQEGTPAALEEILSPGFHGRVLDEPAEVDAVNDFSQVRRVRAADQPIKSVDRSGFIAQLLEYRGLFSQPPQVKLALITLSPIDRGDMDGIWRGTAQLRMWGVGEPEHPAEVTLYLDYDLLRPSEELFSQPNWLLACSINQSTVGASTAFLMHEVAQERGLDVDALHDNWKIEDLKDPTASSGGVYLADYNRDGSTDLMVTDIGLEHGYALYQGLAGGKFADVTKAVELPSLPIAGQMAAAWVDLNGDGWEDLLLAGRVFRNHRGQGFVDVTFLSKGWHIAPAASGISVADYDRDGLMDLYVTFAAQSESGSWVSNEGNYSPGNQLLRNLGDWRFEDVTQKTRTAGGQRSVFTALWLDANNDSLPDLYLIHEFGTGALLVNQGDGTFSEKIIVESGHGDYGSMGATCGDVDNDGDVDLYIAQMYSKAGKRVIGNLKEGTYDDEIMGKLHRLVTGSQLYLNRGDQRFDRVGDEKQVAAVGWAYGPALVDLDNDGWLDIHATCGYISRERGKPDG